MLVVWKRQFTYVYGRLYETNGERSSIRILRYSLDALARRSLTTLEFRGKLADRQSGNLSYLHSLSLVSYPNRT